ncbi:MAG: ATP-binding protein [Anaerolineales bacterium]|nr:MAG: ATP-binding protein [Anaerolineales bacterium]
MDMPLNVQEIEAAPAPQPFEPHMPKSIEGTGLTLGFLADLAIKIMYFEGYISGYEIAEAMKLPYSGVVDEVLEFLKREQFCEVKGAGGLGESAYQYVISLKGSEKAREVLDRGQYVGPAPVPLEDYTNAFHKQPLQNVAIHKRVVLQALSHVVLNERIYRQLGPAVNSGRSVFLYGPPGNGKTTIAESIGMMIFRDNIYVPYAVEVDGQIIKVFDSINHRPVEGNREASSSKRGNKTDRRWVKIHRPFIVTGGELTLEGLDLVYDSSSKFYEAPFQMRANGGMFLIDDFGRQQVRPRDLLNRWIVPLEKRVDFLTLHTGRKIEIPFDVLIVFATNLAPTDLVDEAFLRRIRHKIEIRDPSFEEYREIFKRVCAYKGVPYDDKALAYLLQEHYIKPQVPMRACHPRDIIDQLIDIARYQNRPPVLTKDLIDQACEAYFVEL